MQRAAEIALSFSHTRPNGNSCFLAWDGTGSWYALGENISAGYSSALSAFRGWREDDCDYSGQGHRRNMLSTSFDKIGIGHVVFNGMHYWTQAFGYGSGSLAETEACDSATEVKVSVLGDSIQNGALKASPASYDLTTGESSALPELIYSFRLADTWPQRNFDTSVTADWSSKDADIVSVEGNVMTACKAGSSALTSSVNGVAVNVPVTVKEPGTQTENIITVKPKTKTIAFKSLKKKAQTFRLKASVKENAETTFKLASVTKKAKKYITVTSSGKVKIKKGLAKGSYKIKVKVTASATQNYKKTTATKSINVKVQ